MKQGMPRQAGGLERAANGVRWRASNETEAGAAAVPALALRHVVRVALQRQRRAAHVVLQAQREQQVRLTVCLLAMALSCRATTRLVTAAATCASPGAGLNWAVAPLPPRLPRPQRVRHLPGCPQAAAWAGAAAAARPSPRRAGP